MKNKAFLIQFVILTVACVAILVQGFTHWVPLKLAGFVGQPEKVQLNWKTYSEGKYQDYLSDYAKQKGGFREPCIRAYNQCLYSLFKKTTNDNIVFGENGELYLEMYLHEVTGKTLKDCYGSEDYFKSRARKDIEKTLVLIDSLRRHNTAFLFVEAPSKTWVYPEYMPQPYRDSIMPFCVQDYYTQLFEENGIPHIDFLSYFKSLKGKTEYPLYSPYGTHWAESTIPFVADSILRKIESLIGQEMPHIVCLDENLQTRYSKQDGELEDLMNLMFPLRKPALPQPIMALSDTTLRKPNLLVIADSYFIQLQESAFADCFNRCDYWKYNDEVITKDIEFKGKVSEYLEAYKTIDEADLIMVINTAPYAYNYMFGFCETANLAFLDHDHQRMEKLIEETIERIKGSTEWYESIRRQAEEEHWDLDSLLRGHARYAIWMDEKQRQEQQ
jgi:hypothetical protein